jgi:small subunit ribosomal protein S16
MENLSRRDGKAIRELGYYDPIQKEMTFDRVNLYKSIKNGAYPTDTVRHLIAKLIRRSA